MFLTLKQSMLLLAGVLLGTVLKAQVYVTPSGAGLMNGSSWANAYGASQLPNSLATATAGTEFWVAAGVYKPAVSNRDSSFVIPGDVQVFGGFNGTETALGGRNWLVNRTVLSGDIGVAGDNTDNSHHVVVLQSATSNTLLDGFTITGGNADGPGLYGGGMLIKVLGSFSPRIANDSFIANRASQGGAIYSSRPCTVDSCYFGDNTAFIDSTAYTGVGGGAIKVGADEIGIAELTLRHSVFVHNTTPSFGGAVCNYIRGYSVNGEITNCTFADNYAYMGGAVFIDGFYWAPFSPAVTYRIDSSRFVHDTSSIIGGALCFETSGATNPLLNMAHDYFENNVSNQAGAIHYAPGGTAGKLYLYNSSFVRNTGITTTGAIDITASGATAFDTAVIVNCLFYNNTTRSVAADCATLRNGSSGNAKLSVSLINATVYNDSASIASAADGGSIYNNLYNLGASTTELAFNALNSIIWYGGGPSTFCNSIGSFVIGGGTYYAGYKNALVRKSGGSAAWNPAYGTDLGGNLDVYPRFKDTTAAAYDLRLKCSSPAVNAGSNVLIAPYPLPDLNGNTRVALGTVDMGAYENPVAAPVVIASATTAGLVTTLMNASTGGIDSARWTLSDGTTTTAASLTHTFAAAGSYTACLHLYSSCGDIDTCFTLHPCTTAPVVSFTAVGTHTVTFTAAGTAGADSVRWYFGDGATSTVANPVHTYTSPGTYTSCMYVFTPCGNDTMCSTVTITCIAPVAANYGFSVTSPTAHFHYAGTTASMDSVVWNFGDGTPTSTVLNPDHTYTATGVYTVCVTVYTACGNNTYCHGVGITCVAPVASFTATGAPTVSYAYTGTVADSVRWYFGDGGTSNLVAPTHTYADTGAYHACVIAYSACARDTFCNDVHIHCTIAPTASITHTGTHTVTFTYTSSTTADSVLWVFGDGDTDRLASPVHTYTANGTYHACLTVYTHCGTDTVCSDVVISGLTGIAGIIQTGISIYPNPAHSKLCIDNAGGYPIKISDITGREQYTLPESLNPHREIPLINLPPGVYIIRIGNVEVRKFVKE